MTKLKEHVQSVFHTKSLENVRRPQNKQGIKYQDKEFEGTVLIQSTENRKDVSLQT